MTRPTRTKLTLDRARLRAIGGCSLSDVVIAFERMLPGVVAIVVPPETPAPWVEAAAAACDAALGAGRCLPAPAEGATWRAVIIGPTLEAPTTLNIELYSTGGNEPGGSDAWGTAPEATRNLRFGEVDSERQRWASAGVVVAAMVSAGEAERTSSLEPEAASVLESPRDRATTPARTEPPQESGAQVWLDGAFALSSGLEGEPPAPGAQLAVGARPTALPAVVVARFAIASRQAPFEARWLTGAIGAGLRPLDGPALTMDIVPELQLQHFRAQVTRDDPSLGSATDAGGHVRVGMGLEMTSEWRLAEPVGVVLGGNISYCSPVLNIVSEDEPVGRVSDFGWGGWVGLRWITLP